MIVILGFSSLGHLGFGRRTAMGLQLLDGQEKLFLVLVS
jgi:hypothetical protein